MTSRYNKQQSVFCRNKQKRISRYNEQYSVITEDGELTFTGCRKQGLILKMERTS